MAYTSISFLIFILAAFLIYFLVPSRFRWWVLLAASYTFYIVNSKWLTLCLLGSTVVFYLTALAADKNNEAFKQKKKGLEKEERKALKLKTQRMGRGYLAIGIVINLGVLLVLKYSGFFADTASAVAGLFNTSVKFDAVKFVLPLGISYYTLSGISYITDVYHGIIRAEKNPFKLALFMSYFPQIVEGPFARYNLLGETLFSGSSFDIDRAVSGIIRIFWGFFKKLVIADRIAVLVNEVFSNGTYGGSVIIIGALFYTLQIYADFSGCMDMVCGVSEVFGVRLSENFRQPFFSRSIDEFWRRWHITLGAWLKDYIFYPVSLTNGVRRLSQNARNKLGSYYGSLLAASLALFCVWFTNGFWHGAGWKYICYGLYYFALMMLGKLVKPLSDKFFTAVKINKESAPFHIFEVVRTLIIVVVGMLIFRADTLTQALNMLGKVFTDFGGKALIDGTLLSISDFKLPDLLITAIGVILMITISIYKERDVEIRTELGSRPYVEWTLVFLLLMAVVIFGKYGSGSGSSVFIYGQF